MRPVVRGPHPQKSDGTPVGFAHYRDARNYLMKRMGDYCSYCELPCKEGPDVEHVRPKSLHPSLERAWDNFLLGCNFCNSTKGDQDVDVKDYLWPDRDNTFKAFIYDRDMPPKVAGKLSVAQKALAQRTLELTGLERAPGHPKLTGRDLRWIHRRDAWRRALDAKQRLQALPHEAMKAQIIETAEAVGFWSVWLTVFQEDLDMKRRLLDAFPGTAGIGVCFGQELQAISRPGGEL